MRVELKPQAKSMRNCLDGARLRLQAEEQAAARAEPRAAEEVWEPQAEEQTTGGEALRQSTTQGWVPEEKDKDGSPRSQATTDVRAVLSQHVRRDRRWGELDSATVGLPRCHNVC